MSKKSFLCCFCKEDDDQNKDNERKPLLRNNPKSSRSPYGNDDGSDFHERSYSPVKDASEKPLGSPCRNGENAFSDGSDFYAVPEVSVKDGKPSRSVEKSASKSTADSAKGAEAVEQKNDAFADDEDKKKIEEEIAAERDHDSKERNDAKQEGAKKKEKSESGDEKTKKKKKDDLHKSLKFEKVGFADIDNVFTSLASTFNPFVETRERIQTARESFENIVTSMRDFSGKKELKEYLQELKKDAKEGNITIYIDTEDGEIKVKAVEGVKPPKLYRDAVKALNDLHSSVKEAVELEPHVQLGIEECFERINHIDPKRDFHDLLQKKKDVFTLPGKIKKFNDNRKKLQEIPGIVKEFFLYVNRLLEEMLEILTGEKEENTTEEENSKEDEQEEDIREDSKEDEQEEDISDREGVGEGEDGDREDNGEDSGDQDYFEDSEESDEDEK
ncbi:PREDICTED: glutamic acid-rich protein-like isoform X1 [Acropora digitifera]|uniref:glutamic acid-rich protein-like isoform X1 n=1 Tax=Acropora digitifera TaxID=70779 RepID=UPI00077A9619|nr:PREDICTED: glutamic acid-rich protein-like isoform X1 [Acropora digitifera]